jgi:hypothetical protein
VSVTRKDVLQVLTGGLFVAAALNLVSCGTKADAPEPSPSDIINGTHTQVIKMPDGFRNIAFTCYGSVGVYVTSRGVAETDPQPSGVTVLASDPHCAR